MNTVIIYGIIDTSRILPLRLLLSIGDHGTWHLARIRHRYQNYLKGMQCETCQQPYLVPSTPYIRSTRLERNFSQMLAETHASQIDDRHLKSTYQVDVRAFHGAFFSRSAVRFGAVRCGAVRFTAARCGSVRFYCTAQLHRTAALPTAPHRTVLPYKTATNPTVGCSKKKQE